MYNKIVQGSNEGFDVRTVSQGIDKEERLNYEQFLKVSNKAKVFFLLT